MPGNVWLEQETSSCEVRFHQSNERRSRKQRTPRKLMTAQNSKPAVDVQHDAPKDSEGSNPQPVKMRESNQQPSFRCFLCPKDAPARAYHTQPYHGRKSLLLHKLWRHKKMSYYKIKETIVPMAASVTLKATVYTERAFEYQR